MKHLLTVSDLSKDAINSIFENAKNHNLKNDSKKIVASFFAEPSTRTRLSFESAAHKLGWSVISASDAEASSSLKKGESLKDTFRTISQYADLIVFRHNDENWINVARNYSRVPVINAGNGAEEHPTQALLDLFTLQTEIGDLTGKNILFTGDLKYGRTVHSLIKLIQNFGCIIHLCPTTIKSAFEEISYSLPFGNFKALTVSEAKNILPTIDAIYLTRTQYERSKNTELLSNPFAVSKSYFKLDKKLLDTMKKDSAILHPLPRLEELDEDVDDDPRAAYHERQIRNGLYVRMALMDYIFA